MRRPSGIAVLGMLLIGSSLQAQRLSMTPIIGGLPADSGLAFGVELYRPLIIHPADLRVRTIGSVKRYTFLEAGIELPHRTRHNLSFTFAGRYRNYPQEGFWGLGPDTPKEQESSYLMEDLNLTASVELPLWQHLWLEAGGGFLKVNTGPGRDRKVPSIEQMFLPLEAPAVDRQPDYWHGGLAIDYDSRDEPSNPSRGGMYSFGWSQFRHRQIGPFSFNQYEIDLRQFLPAGERSRIGLRARTILTNGLSGHEVPFFMKPTVGGIDTVRGFDQYRFRDSHVFIVNAEYRHAVYTFADAVVFADAGRTFARLGDFAFTKFQPAAGIGFRIRFGNRTFFGMDGGFSREAQRLWFRMGQTF